MTDRYDHVPSYDENGNLRHYTTQNPTFQNAGADTQTINKWAQSAEYTVIEADGETWVMDKHGAIEYSTRGEYADLGEIVEAMQDDQPNGFHLHLTDLHETEKNLYIHRPVRISGPRGHTTEDPDNRVPVDPIGIKYTGDGDGVHVYSETDSPLSGVILENFTVDATESSGNAVKIDGGRPNNTKGLSNIWCRNLAVDGGWHGFWVDEDVFGSTFENILAHGQGGIGIRIGWGGKYHKPSQLQISHLRANSTGSHPISFEGITASDIGHIYGLHAGDQSDSVRIEATECDFGMVYGEHGSRYSVNLVTVESCSFGVVKGRGEDANCGVGIGTGDNGSLYRSSIDVVREGQSANLGVEIVKIARGSVIENLITEVGLSIDSVWDGRIENIVNNGSGPTSFERFTVEDNGPLDQDSNSGWFAVDLHGEYSSKPAVLWRRHSAPIEELQYTNSSGNDGFDQIRFRCGSGSAEVSFKVIPTP